MRTLESLGTRAWIKMKSRRAALLLLAGMLVTQAPAALGAEPQLLATFDDGTLLRKNSTPPRRP